MTNTELIDLLAELVSLPHECEWVEFKHNNVQHSRVIADTIKMNLIKDFDVENKSKKFAKYVPYWL